MSLKTIVVPRPRLQITVTAKYGSGLTFTSSKNCVTAKSAAEFYANTKGVAHRDVLAAKLGCQTHTFPQPVWAALDVRYDRHYRRALRVFKRYLP